MKSKVFVKVVCTFIAVMIISIIIAVFSKPSVIDLDSIEYEYIEAKVINTVERDVPYSKYGTTTYYDVKIEYDGSIYVWTTSLSNPNMQNGFTYKFVMHDGIIYGSPQELRNNLKVQNSSYTFRIATFFIVVSLSGLFVCLTLFLVRYRNNK